MKHYKDEAGKVYAYEDGVSPKKGLVEFEFQKADDAGRVPQVVSRFQALAALYQSGLLESVELAVSESDTLTQLAWKNAQEFRRDSPILKALAESLNLTGDDLDALFKTASQIIA